MALYISLNGTWKVWTCPPHAKFDFPLARDENYIKKLSIILYMCMLPNTVEEKSRKVTHLGLSFEIWCFTSVLWLMQSLRLSPPPIKWRGVGWHRMGWYVRFMSMGFSFLFFIWIKEVYVTYSFHNTLLHFFYRNENEKNVL